MSPLPTLLRPSAVLFFIWQHLRAQDASSARLTMAEEEKENTSSGTDVDEDMNLGDDQIIAYCRNGS